LFNRQNFLIIVLVFIGHRLKLTCAGHNNISVRTEEGVKV
jgi:hypothetical protein